MTNCIDCRHASWDRTKSGRLHPKGWGKCTFPWKMPPLPAAFYFTSTPHLGGGYINRRETLKEHCVCYARAKRP